MDYRLLEFWGRLFLQAARNQKYLEDLLAWQEKSIPLLAQYCPWFFSSASAPEPEAADSDSSKQWEDMTGNLQAAYHDYLQLWGLVPQQQYADLVKECDALKDKVAAQEETIQVLRQLLEEKGLGLAATALEFQKLVEKQGEQFQKFLKGLGEAVRIEKPEG